MTTMHRTGESTSTTPAGRELVITREFDAPRDLVFKVWTEAEHLARWWGPAGSAVHVEKLELRPSGVFHYRLTMPDGYEMWGKFVYREIAPPERIVYTSSFADEEGNTIRAPFSEAFPLEILNSLTFTEQDGKTTLTLHGLPVEPSDAEREMFDSFIESMEQGFAGTMDQLSVYLESLEV